MLGYRGQKIRKYRNPNASMVLMTGIEIGNKTESQKELVELLDYAYIGARYNRRYKITKEQLEQLAPCVKKLHKVTEKICVAKIESFT